jgi:hypothetical protein
MRKKVLFPVVLITMLAAVFMMVSPPADAAQLKWAFQGDVQSLDPYGIERNVFNGFFGQCI